MAGTMSGDRRKAVDVLGVNWIVHNSLPLGVTETDEFHVFMRTATNGAYQGASRETNHGLLLKLAGDGKTNARNFIEGLASEGIKA